MRCRWLMDEAAAGAWNMAADESILEAAIRRPELGPTLRWYSWIEPTLSLGYFQSYEDRPAAVADVPVVRRVTGGGAILHDRELTYSFVFPPGFWPGGDHLRIVRDFHRMLSEILSTIRSTTLHDESEEGDEPYLCFLRRAQGDLVTSGAKVVGSAQRSRQGGLLQHGSILLRRSKWTPQLPGLCDLGLAITAEEIASRMTEQITDRWQFEFQRGMLSGEEKAHAERLVTEKYANDDWTQRR